MSYITENFTDRGPIGSLLGGDLFFYDDTVICHRAADNNYIDKWIYKLWS